MNLWIHSKGNVPNNPRASKKNDQKQQEKHGDQISRRIRMNMKRVGESS